jgi:hypothetical protein
VPVLRRYLIKDMSGRLVDLSSRAFDHAYDGTIPLPDYAGQCVDVVAAVLVGNGHSAPHITEVAFTKLYFDDSGFVDAGRRDRMIRLLLESCADRRGKERSPADRQSLARRAGQARQSLDREYAWRPAPAEVSEVLMRLDGQGTGGRTMATAAGPTLH